MKGMREKMIERLVRSTSLSHYGAGIEVDFFLSLETKTRRIAVIPRGESPLVVTPVYRDGADPEGCILRAKQAQKKLSDEFYKGGK